MRDNDQILLERAYMNISFKQYLYEKTDMLESSDVQVLISDYVKKHISEHNTPGIGSVFSKNINFNTIYELITSLNIQDDGGMYTVKVPGVGYNLVLPIDQALELPDAEQTEVTKTERGQSIEVPAIKTSADISNFETDDLTIIIRPSNPDYLPDDVKQNQQVLQAIQDNKSYSVLTAFPGDPNIPPASEWNGQYAVIIPS